MNQAHLSAQPATEAAPKRGDSLSGYSLLARGEPQVWFTGGMLAVCLFMIVGLLGYIVWAGLPTFWPRPVEWLVLSDGALEIGQFQAAEQQTAAVSAESPSTQQISSEPSRYYRTGNFDLTGQHYRWLTPEQLDSSGIASPAWAMVVERLENGRLYGLLGQLALSADIGSATRQQLGQLTQLQDWLNALPEVDAEVLPQVTTAITAQHSRLLDAALRSAIQQAPSADALPQAQTSADANWVPLAEIAADNPLTAARHLLTDPAQVYAQLSTELHHSTQMRHRLESVRYQISRLDAELSELRAELRRAEIATQVQAAQSLESSHYLLDQLEALRLRQEQASAMRQLVEQVGANQTWLPGLLEKLELYTAQTLPAEVAAVETQVNAWLAPVAAQPEPIHQAVTSYLTGYREIIVDKRPLLEELTELETLLGLAQVSFWMPVAPQALPVAEADLQQLLDGQVTVAVRDALATLQITVSATAAEVVELNGRCTLAVVRNAAAEPLALAIVRAKPETSSTDSASSDSASSGAPAQPSASSVMVLPTQTVPCAAIVRAFPANQLTLGNKLSIYLDRWREFLLENPREANTEGGVFPAIWGTVVMTLIMTVAVVPFGVMAALYLREYTKSGPLVSIIRISINNLAGVPSIVYGVFGFSFFCYTLGAFIDGGPKNADLQPWPPNQWFLMLAGVVGLGTCAFFASLSSGKTGTGQTGRQRLAARAGLILWLSCVALTGWLILKSPFFDGFYQEYLPNPTFGKGGLLWASLTLALLTLPVVIVATEEALAAVPNSLREGSLACGASKWQTIYRIILPHAQPGILTGAILAMARGAGEVAPLMLVGALASAPDLPLDSEFPFFHGSRSFMHLGYQIYTLGFQSQNSEAAKPMVFTCTLLLMLIVAVLNLTAILLRSRLKRQFQSNQF